MENKYDKHSAINQNVSKEDRHKYIISGERQSDKIPKQNGFSPITPETFNKTIGILFPFYKP